MYAELSKENQKELQEDYINSQRQMLGEIMNKQKESNEKLLAMALKEERKIAESVTDRMICGLKDILLARSDRKSTSPRKNETENLRQPLRNLENEEDEYFGLDSSKYSRKSQKDWY